MRLRFLFVNEVIHISKIKMCYISCLIEAISRRPDRNSSCFLIRYFSNFAVLSSNYQKLERKTFFTVDYSVFIQKHLQVPPFCNLNLLKARNTYLLSVASTTSDMFRRYSGAGTMMFSDALRVMLYSANKPFRWDSHGNYREKRLERDPK